MSQQAHATFLVAVLFALRGVAASASDLRLIEAAQRQDAEVVRALLSKKADVNAAQPDGTTALHWAAHRDSREIAALLIKAGAHVNAVTDLGVPPLALACGTGSVAMVETLLAAGANPRATLPNGETLLMTCVRTGALAAVKALVTRGADPNVRDATRGQTALMWAAAGRHPAVVKLLVDHGADVNAKSGGGFTPLLFAAREGDAESARILLSAGADINVASPQGESPLLIAAASMVAVSTADYNLVPSPSGHEALGILLVERGANLKQANEFGQTALHVAVDTRKFGLVRALLARGADPNAQLTKALPFRRGDYVGRAGHRGASPFWLAAMAADVEMMRVLLAGGANPRLPSSNRTSPLMVAAGLGQTDSRMPPQEKMLEAVTFLLELDGDVNSVNAAGQSSMHGAASVSADGILQFLADRGGNVTLKDKSGRIPWDLTQSVLRPRPATAALLRKLEAAAANRAAK